MRGVALRRRGGGRLVSCASARPLFSVWLGRMAYRPCWELQRRLAAARASGRAPYVLLLVEHEPVYTLGRAARREHVLWDEAECARRGVEVVEVDRGGDVTYHGPGQLVGYPVVDLRPLGLGVREYVRALEEAMLRLLRRFGVEGRREPGLPGVWVGSAKVGAIGVRCSRGITTHGFAFNVDPDPEHFAGIVPCGLRDRGVTSLAAVLGRPVGLEEAVRPAGECVARALGFPGPAWASPGELEDLLSLSGATGCAAGT